MIKKLYLIGNGFDLAHGLKTRYLDFMVWLHKNDRYTFINISKLMLDNFLSKNGYLFENDFRYRRPENKMDIMINTIDLGEIINTEEYKLLDSCFEEPLMLYIMWDSLEEYIYYLFLDEQLAQAENERQNLIEVLKNEEYGEVIDEDIDVLFRPAQERFERLANLSRDFNEDLFQWVGDVNSSISYIKNSIEFYEAGLDNNTVISMLPDDFFGDDNYIITFNYSDTIEKLYSKEVCHIHGKYSRSNAPIMGHTKDISDIFLYYGKESILVKEFYKDYYSIIESYAEYYNKIKGNEKIDEIIVLGLGYNYTDFPYFEKISQLLPDVKWLLYYYSDSDYEKAENYVKKLNLSRENITYASIKEKSPYTEKKFFNEIVFDVQIAEE